MYLTEAELAVAGAATMLQLLTLSFWLAARLEARYWRKRAEDAERYSLRRDPKTGRYLRGRKD
jgi:hypothetical protein